MVHFRVGRVTGLLCAGLFAALLLAAPEAAPAPLLGEGNLYRIQADAEGVRFRTEAGDLVEFKHAKVFAGTGLLSRTHAAPSQKGKAVRYDHGDWAEEYFPNPSHLEQSFVFRKPLRTAVTVRVPVKTDLSPEAIGAEVHFKDRNGRSRIGYKDALAMDAAGRTQKLAITLESGEIAIQLPREYMESAKFPVVLDPSVGLTGGVSGSGEIFRTMGIDVTWNATNQYYFTVYNMNVVYDDPDRGHQPHFMLDRSQVWGRAIRFDAAGNITYGPEFQFGPFTTGGGFVGRVAFGPAVTWNAVNNQFMTVWAEGNWRVGPSTGNTQFDDILTNLNNNNLAEHLQLLDPYPNNSRIAGRQFTVDPVTLAITALGATPMEISLPPGGNPADWGNLANGASHPAMHPDVDWDGTKYIVVWAGLSSAYISEIEAFTVFEYRHMFWTFSQSKFATYTSAQALSAGTPQVRDLGAAKERLFIKGPPTVLTNIRDGLLASNLDGELVYPYVPTDQHPRVASIVHPGVNNAYGDGDDVPVGSLLTFNQTSLVFNEPKGRVRARFMPGGAANATPSVVFDIYSSQASQVVQRAFSAGGPSLSTANPAENSHFTTVFQQVDDLLYKGNLGNPDVVSRAVEFSGTLNLRMSQSSNGYPAATVVPLPAEPNSLYLSPSISWNRETEQYLIHSVRVDTALFNPVVVGYRFYPKAFSVLDSQAQPLASVASLYPTGVGATRPYIDPLDPYAPPNHHHVIVGVENDFSSSWYQRFLFDVIPPAPDSTLSVTPVNLTYTTPSPNDPANPSPQLVTVTNTGPSGSLLAFSVEFPSGPIGWLSVTPTSGLLAAGQSMVLSVSVNPPPPSLPSATTTASFEVRAPGANSSPITVNVTLIVAGGAPPPGGGGGGVVGSGGEGGEGSSCGLLGAEVLLGLLALKLVARSRRRR